MKPRLRGASHAVAFALSPLAAIALHAGTPSQRAFNAGLIYAISMAALFGTSALYHIPMWTPGPRRILRRLDYATIFIFIAGTSTPFAALLTPSRQAMLMAIAWGGAALGVLQALFWTHAPRSLRIGLYMTMGWAHAFFAMDFYQALGPARLGLIVAGGLCYSAGAIIYARRRPDPVPHVFGFHEIFHVLVIAAAGLHYTVVASILRELR